LAILLLHLTPALPDLLRAYALIFIGFFVMANLALGTFNLLPVPPLDGGRVVVGLLPERLALAWARLERAGIILVLVLLFIAPPLLRDVGIRINPLADWLHAVGDPIFRLLVAAAGHPQDIFLVLRVLGADGV
jgi:Zn-dependent protease